MTIRQYSSRSQQTTLTGAITSGATSMTVVSGTGLLGGVTIPAGRTFTLVIDVDTALEEIVDATAVSTNTFTITRGRDGSTAQEHSAGAVVRHMAIGRDYRDANLHTQADASYNDGGGNAQSLHGIAAGEGVVVGTLKTQTLTNKTLTSPVISNPTITGTSGVETSIVFEGSTADAHETTLTVVDPTQDNTITLPNTSGTVTINDATQTLTNKTLTSPTISGSPVITGLSSAGMISSSATPKDYVDSILGSATAAATSAASAATSAASAATSASSASTSASSALTSANSASTSATAAATSATSAAASATAAATSATSASNSASAASTSATSAATSASSALTSANSASTSAASALTSANSASTSATASASSASAAATSATSAAASATAAATSATSASASATAAATSATSAANSATAASTSATNAATSATSAAASATAAATSEANASASATAAATSASSASTSASSALTSANSASTSASSALTSANSAATSATSAATSYDQFDDRYLGDKTSDPTVDNDGNPLLTGALYFNTVLGAMKVYDGAAWDLVAPDTSNFVDKALWTGKGALVSATGASTPAALTVASTNGWILAVNSATSTGLEWVAPNPGDITSVTAGTGLSGGGTSGDVTLNLANTAVTAGSYTYSSITVDAQGRLTAASSGTAPVTSVSAGSGIGITGGTTPTVAVDSTVLRTTGGQVISANTSANALEIRQIGAGNAFVVEDDTNPDATPTVITSAGSVGIGTSSPASSLHIDGGFVTSQRYAAAGVFRARRANGTAASPTQVVANDIVYYSDGVALDDTGIYRGVAGIGMYAAANITSTSSPGYLQLSTTASGSTSLTERMRIDSAGNVNIGTDGSVAAGGTNTGGLNIAGQDVQLMTIMGAW